MLNPFRLAVGVSVPELSTPICSVELGNWSDLSDRSSPSAANEIPPRSGKIARLVQGEKRFYSTAYGPTESKIRKAIHQTAFLTASNHILLTSVFHALRRKLSWRCQSKQKNQLLRRRPAVR